MSNLLIFILVVAVLAIAAVVWMYLQKQKRTQKLRSKFGTEYERVVEGSGDRSRAENVLQEREKRVESFNITPLQRQDRERFAQTWNNVQSQFVNDPPDAVATADRLLIDVMKARGYPIGDFEQRAADISVDHPELVENYRIAHDIALRDRGNKGEVNTEDLRKAMVHYRGLFEELLEDYIEPEVKLKAKAKEVGR
jgi:hypothetical protein